MISEKLFVGIYKSIVLYFAEYQTERKGRLSIDKSTNSVSLIIIAAYILDEGMISHMSFV